MKAIARASTTVCRGYKQKIGILMMNEETYISNKIGRENPFTVPEGYFDSLTERVMQQLPQQQGKAPVVSLRRWLYAAACVVCLFVVGTVAYTSLDSDSQQPLLSETVETTVTDDYLDEAADYAMIENHDIYLCLMND